MRSISKLIAVKLGLLFRVRESFGESPGLSVRSELAARRGGIGNHRLPFTVIVMSVNMHSRLRHKTIFNLLLFEKRTFVEYVVFEWRKDECNRRMVHYGYI